MQPRTSVPVLHASDYPTARAFYVSLGFNVAEEGGDPPRFGIFRLGGAEIYVDAWNGADPVRQAGWRAYLHVANVDDVAAELAAKGINIVRGPATAPYGMREVEIADPDGNLLCFGADV